MNSSGIYIEITQSSLKALRGEEGLELPLERALNGRLTEPCQERVVARLREFLHGQGGRARTQAYCAISARGVSLRRLTVPAAGKEEFQRMLLMQIESEFPLSPEELAWGYRALGETRQNGAARKDLLVVAVRKEVVAEYSALLSKSGLTASFTLAALARAAACPQTPGSFAVLEVAEQNSELAWFEHGVPINVRTVPFGENQTSADGLVSFAKALNGSWSGKKLFVSGTAASFKTVSSCLGEQFNSGVECEPLKINSGKGWSTAILGLKNLVETNDAKLLFFQSPAVHEKVGFALPAPRKWAVLAAVLALSFLLLPYAEALLLKPWLAKKISTLRTQEGRLATIDRELEFLQHLKQNQPPYLDSLYLFARSAPPGAKIETLTMNRSGEVSLRSSMRNADQVAEFRNKLINSGFFSSVTVEEQTPTPDKQKVNIRVSAQWKTPVEIQKLAIGPTAEEIEKAKSKKDSPGGMPPGFSPGAMPMGMPVGIPPGFSPDLTSPRAMPPGAMPAGLPPEIKISRPGSREGKE